MEIRRLEPVSDIPGLRGLTLGDFWSWAYSDVFNNRNRAVFAEFLVGVALDALDKPRIEWDFYDLTYKGKGIEVKSSAYLQSWHQERPSVIRFDIARKIAWDYRTNRWADTPTRSADLYVFCLYGERDAEKVDVFNLAAWEFFIVTTQMIDARFGNQKSVGITPLRSYCKPCAFPEIKTSVDCLLDQ